MNSLFLALTNTKSDVIVSSEFKANPDPDCIVPNNLNGLLPAVSNPSFVPKLRPSCESKSNAAAFNKIVPISGKNKPYDPFICSIT